RRRWNLRCCMRRATPGSPGARRSPGYARFAVKVSLQVPCSDRLFQLFQRGEIRGQRLAVSEFGGAVAAFGVDVVEQARSSALVGVFVDVARVLGILQVSGNIKLNNLVVIAQSL